MRVIKEEGGRPIKIWTDEIEDPALRQLKNLARLPFICSNGIAAMPDVHLGKGATVGSVIATDGAVIPAAVGVDIGCGMNAVRLSIKASDLPDNLRPIREAIEEAVPLGAGGAHSDASTQEKYADQPEIRALFDRLGKLPGAENGTGAFGAAKAAAQLGTLGSGNHFVELCLDESSDVWIMLHSGSRGIGNKIGSRAIELAKKDMKKFFIQLPDDDLAYFPEGTEHFSEYMEAVQWAQDYAMENRRQMMRSVIAAIAKTIPIPFSITEEAINCHHNYVTRENHFGRNLWVTRKGAIRAREGDLGIIPGSMGRRSFIVRGKGNLQSYCSCSHGAGRRMSRGEAIKRFTVADLQEQTVGVECRKDAAVLDELPAAYKDIDQVMANQSDLVEVVHTLKQVLCVKGA